MLAGSILAKVDALPTGSALDSMLDDEYEEIMLRAMVERIARDKQARPKYLVNTIPLSD